MWQVGNISKSVLTFRPRHEDDHKMLTCRAENTQMEEGALQDSWRLTVHCKLELQTKILKDFTIMEKAPNRALSWLKAPTESLNFANLRLKL